MQIIIELDEKTVERIDATAKESNINRLQYINQSVQKSLHRDLRKKKFSNEEIKEMYREGYGNFPVQPDEFEIEDEQMQEFWNNV